MPLCTDCGKPFVEERRKLGYRTCPICGDVYARAEANRRKRCVAPLYNKGAYQYIGNIDQVSDIGKK